MKATKNRTRVITGTATAMLGLTLIGLASCSSGDSSSGTVTTGGSAALQNPLLFINNRDDKTLSVIGVDGAGNPVITTMGQPNPPQSPNGVFEGNALGDMQFSDGEWVFMNLGAGNSVATIDPLSGATPIHEENLPTGERPVHIYRDPTDGEVMWSMNDGNATTGLDSINCAAQGGGSVTVLHNSHLGPGGHAPVVVGTTCLLAAGHKVAAFPQPTVTNPAIPKRAFVSSTTAGEVAVLDNAELLPNNQPNPNYRSLINRIDLCTDAGQLAQNPPALACDVNANALNTPNTPNSSNPHGIRWSKFTGKVYSIQENYRTIVEIDPATMIVTRTVDLAPTRFTSFGITPDGRFLFLRGQDVTADLNHVIGKLGVIDLNTAQPTDPLAVTPFNGLPEMNDVAPSSFKFSPDGQRLYLTQSNSTTGLSANQATNLKRDRLFSYNCSTFPVAPQLLAEIILPPATGHMIDVLVESVGAITGVATGIAVSNGTPAAFGSVTLIDAATHAVAPPITVGRNPGAVMVYYPGAAVSGNHATSSLTGGSKAKPSVLPERLDDHGMPD